MKFWKCLNTNPIGNKSFKHEKKLCLVSVNQETVSLKIFRTNVYLLRNRGHKMTAVVKRLNFLGKRGHFMTAVVKRLNLLGNRGHFMTAVVKRKNSLETAVILCPPLSRGCNFLFLYNFCLFIFSIKALLKYVYSLCPVLFCAPFQNHSVESLPEFALITSSLV